MIDGLGKGGRENKNPGISYYLINQLPEWGNFPVWKLHIWESKTAGPSSIQNERLLPYSALESVQSHTLLQVAAHEGMKFFVLGK